MLKLFVRGVFIRWIDLLWEEHIDLIIVHLEFIDDFFNSLSLLAQARHSRAVFEAILFVQILNWTVSKFCHFRRLRRYQFGLIQSPVLFCIQKLHILTAYISDPLNIHSFFRNLNLSHLYHFILNRLCVIVISTILYSHLVLLFQKTIETARVLHQLLYKSHIIPFAPHKRLHINLSLTNNLDIRISLTASTLISLSQRALTRRHRPPRIIRPPLTLGRRICSCCLTLITLDHRGLVPAVLHRIIRYLG